MNNHDKRRSTGRRMDDHNHTQFEALSKLVQTHDNVLYGIDGEGGLVTTVALLAQTQRAMVRLLWLVATGFFTAFGGGIYTLFTLLHEFQK